MNLLKREVSRPRRSDASRILILFAACAIFVMGNMTGFYRGLRTGVRQADVASSATDDVEAWMTAYCLELVAPHRLLSVIGSADGFNCQYESEFSWSSYGHGTSTGRLAEKRSCGIDDPLGCVAYILDEIAH